MTSPDERFDDAWAIEIQVARYLNLKCSHCGDTRLHSLEGRHICIVAPYDFLDGPGTPEEVIRLYRLQAIMGPTA